MREINAKNLQPPNKKTHLKVGEGAYIIKINGNISIYFDT